MQSELERSLETQFVWIGLSGYEREFKFHPTRKWRFDYAFPDRKIAIEIEGGTFGRVVVCNNCGSRVMRTLKDGSAVPVREGGRHNTGAGFEADLEKYNEAAILGWRVVRVSAPMILDETTAIGFIERIWKES